ncbi:hypothetical protein AUJ14_03875 [Candidatus Micrarchaeota archaeon CG1_02_55_22]|nr:MAG: hypothetical protein AUJ14_03875 [Candidatus Micrarchaeota archaeon CG1_02_55_22]
MINVRIGFVGLPRLCRALANQLSNNGLDAQDYSCKTTLAPDADIVHEVYAGSGGPIALTAKLAGKKVVRHWIGSDVLEYTDRRPPRLQMRVLKLPGALNALTTVNASIWNNLQSELPFASKVLPIATEEYAKAKPAGKPSNKVLCYSGGGREWKYGLDYILQTASKCPQLEFRVLSCIDTRLDVPSNVNLLGRVDAVKLEEEYANCLALYRPSRHDGLPGMVLEALARQIPVLYSQELPHCALYASPEQAAEWLNELADNPRRLPLKARDWVVENFSTRKLAKQYETFYEELL